MEKLKCQRSEKEWWLVTFRLCRCFGVLCCVVRLMLEGEQSNEWLQANGGNVSDRVTDGRTGERGCLQWAHICLQHWRDNMFKIQVSEGWIKKSAAAGSLSTLAEVNNHPPKWTIICIAPPTHPPMCSAAICFHPIGSKFYHFTSGLSEKTNIVQRKKISKYICVYVGRVCDSVCLSNILKTCPEFNAFILRFSKIECHGIKKNGPGKRKKLSEIRWWQNDHWRVWHLGTQSNQRCSVYNKWLLAFEKKARRFIFMEKFTLWNAHKYIIFDMA